MNEKLNHDLSVAYSELESQNQELRDLNNLVEIETDKFFRLFYQMPLMIFVTDSKGTILSTNECAQRNIKNKLQKKIFTSYIKNTSDKRKFYHTLTELDFNTNTCIRKVELTFDQTILNCDIYIFYLIVNEEKNFYNIIIDNSETELLNFKINQINSQYKVLFESMFNGVVLYQLNESNSEAKIILVNKSFTRLTGIEKSIAEGSYIADLFPTAEVFINNIKECIATQKTISFNLFSKDVGKEFICNLYSVDVDKCICIFELSTLQINFERQLKSTLSIFDNTMEGLVVTNESNKIIHINKSFTDITGYYKDEVLGSKPDIFKSGYHDALFYKSMWRQLIKNGKWQGEIWSKRKNGQCYPQWSTTTTITDENKKITNYICVFSDISSLKTHEQELFNLAHLDHLTNLPNRLAFDSHAIEVLKLKKNIALLFIDLDGFKNINDTLGHNIGDEVLIFIANKLKSLLRSTDFISRFGGDEFVIMLEFNNLDNIINITEMILKEFLNSKINKLNISLTFSIGISLYPQHGDDILTLLKYADIALYEVKRSGKNNYKIFESSMTKSVNLRARTDLQIRRALLNNEFFLEYQPIYSSKTLEIESLEALVRWNSPEYGILYPDAFIQIAEETNLIIDIGEYVYNKIINDIKLFNINTKISINYSIRQLEKKDSIKTLIKILNENNININNIEIEVTESTVMGRSINIINNINEIKENQINLVIDDFGTGYSSLGYLKDLPICKIKIDKIFLRDVPDIKTNCSLVKAIISLAQNLGLKVVSEGVETINQLEFLKENDCDYIQGYYLSKPKSLSKILKK